MQVSRCISALSERRLQPFTETQRRYSARSASLVAGTDKCRASGKQPGQPDHSDLLPDISSLSPELQQEWHVGRNAHLGGIKVQPMSNKRAVWECKKCPAAQPHVWSAFVFSRSKGTKCPYCRNKEVCLHNSLVTVAPQAAKCWNQSKNEKAPHQVLAGSSSRAEWKCPDCSWEWQACIQSRVSKKSGCPKCSVKTRRGRHHPTFEEDRHPVMEDWDHERNAADGIFPHNTTHGSGKLVHWICKCCPKERLHRYQAAAFHRTLAKPTGCPYCAGHQACICNSLESRYPTIAAEMDCDRNGFTAAEVLAHSAKIIWWQDQQGHSWRQSVQTRTARCLTQTEEIGRPLHG